MYIWEKVLFLFEFSVGVLIRSGDKLAEPPETTGTIQWGAPVCEERTPSFVKVCRSGSG